jgi:hypothetical protein
MIQTTVGCRRDIARTLSALIVVSVITNAAEAVATLPNGHPVVAGDYVVFASGWRDLDQRIVRVKSVVAEQVTLEGFDTTNTDLFPAGAGIGSLRRITAWDRIQQAEDNKTSGGDRQWLTQQVDGEEQERKIPSIIAATTVSISVYDDVSMPWYQTALAASKTGTPAGYLITLKTGAVSVVNTHWAVNETPQFDKNKEVITKIDLAFLNTPMRYAS